jgi:ectoine hydroxylase-related dioxygenase (phytanoyl-CoA dioxygenase family)
MLKDAGKQITEEGFAIIEDIFTDDEIQTILSRIEVADKSAPAFKISDDLFAIRQFLKMVPAATRIIFNNKLKSVIADLFGNDCFVVKSIYFDKPEQSNWFVAYHQDLTISVDKKLLIDGFGPWTVKQNQFSVQPPMKILENNFTIRIHLDNTDENNGALKVVPQSHLKGVYRTEAVDWEREKETICNVKKGGIMIMRPLLLHASNRSTNNNKRRVIHIEFSNVQLPGELKWSELLEL